MATGAHGDASLARVEGYAMFRFKANANHNGRQRWRLDVAH